MSKFSLLLEKVDGPAYNNDEVDSHNALLNGAVKAGDIKYPNVTQEVIEEGE